MAVLLREDLDTLKCPVCQAGPDQHELFVHAKCHPEANVEVGYSQGILTIYCGECHNPIFRIAVAGG